MEQKTHRHIHCSLNISFTKPNYTGKDNSIAETTVTKCSKCFHGPMDLRMLDLFHGTCTSAMYEVNLIMRSSVFCNKNYCLPFMLAVLLLLICSAARRLKTIKSNLLLQAGLTPKLHQAAYGLVQESFQNPRGWGFHNLYRQPFAVLNHTYFQFKFFICNC